MPSLTARSNTPQSARKETHRRRRSCANPCSLATRANVCSRRSTCRCFIDLLLVSIRRQRKALYCEIDELPEMARLSDAEQSFSQRIGDGLASDVRPMRFRKNVHDRTLHCGDRYSLVISPPP